MAPLDPMKIAAPERQPSVPDDIHTRLRTYSLLGLAFAVVWLVVNRPFWRHVFMAVSAMLFATVLLPKEMMFFVRHPVFLFALPFATGFVAANLGKSTIGTVVACVVLAVLAVAMYRSLGADPVANTWLWPTIRGGCISLMIPSYWRSDFTIRERPFYNYVRFLFASRASRS